MVKTFLIILESGKKFQFELPDLWANMGTDKKRKLQEYLFTKEILLENNKFRTTKIRTILRVIEDKNYRQSSLAGDCGKS